MDMDYRLGEYLPLGFEVDAKNSAGSPKTLRAIKDRFEASEQDFAAQTLAAQEVGELLRETLDFAAVNSLTPLLRPDNLANNLATNCFGHTIVASECLDDIGVEHFIAYINGHSVVLVVDEKSEKAFVLDAAMADFCVETTGFVDLKAAIDGLATDKLYGDTRFDSQTFIHEQRAKKQLPELIEKLPWLSFSTERKLFTDKDVKRDFTLFARLYPSVPGRLMLQHHHDAFVRYERGEYSEVSDAVVELDGIWPDVDMRGYDDSILGSAIKKAIANGLYDQAVQMAVAYDSSLMPEDVTKNRLVLADTLRKIARGSRRADIAKAALNLYERSDVKNRQLRWRKMQAGRLLLQELLLEESGRPVASSIVLR